MGQVLLTNLRIQIGLGSYVLLVSRSIVVDRVGSIILGQKIVIEK